MRRTIGCAVLLTLLMAGRANAVTYRTADETKLEAMTNQTRASVGVKPLKHDTGLQGMARAQAVRMAARGDIYHNPNLSSDITKLGYNWRMVGENVGMGPDADMVYAALLKSPHHYENIVRSNYTAFGIGEVDGPGDRVYIVQVFAEIVPAVRKTVARAPHVTAPTAAPRPAVSSTPASKPASRPAGQRPAVRRPDPNALLGGLVFRADVR